MFHVKHSDRRSSVSTLQDLVTLVADKGITLHETQQTLLKSLAHWLAQKAPRAGLSKYNTVELVWERAMAPALAILDVLNLACLSSCADLGAGTGALGLTLGIVQPHLHVDLVDRSRRAVVFMQLLTHHLGLPNVAVICAQAHELATKRPSGYDLVCIRAVAAGEKALQIAALLATEHKYVAAWHRSDDQAYLHPPPQVEHLRIASTIVTGLSISIYKRAG